MEIKGKVIKSLGLESGTSKTGNPWQKATIIVEYGNSQYPKQVAITNMKKAQEFASIPVGQTWLFQVDIESREYNGRYYTEVKCWDFAHYTDTTQPQYTPQPQQPYQTQYAQPTSQVNAYPPQPQSDDGIPF